MSEEREPLLSNEAMRKLSDFRVRDWYEAKITSGELMVVKTARMMDVDGHTGICTGCGLSWDLCKAPSNGEFCQCGAKIVEP